MQIWRQRYPSELIVSYKFPVAQRLLEGGVHLRLGPPIRDSNILGKKYHPALTHSVSPGYMNSRRHFFVA
jgi:hypothetical protein